MPPNTTHYGPYSPPSPTRQSTYYSNVNSSPSPTLVARPPSIIIGSNSHQFHGLSNRGMPFVPPPPPPPLPKAQAINGSYASDSHFSAPLSGQMTTEAMSKESNTSNANHIPLSYPPAAAHSKNVPTLIPPPPPPMLAGQTSQPIHRHKASVGPSHPTNHLARSSTALLSTYTPTPHPVSNSPMFRPPPSPNHMYTFSPVHNIMPIYPSSTSPPMTNRSNTWYQGLPVHHFTAPSIPPLSNTQSPPPRPPKPPELCLIPGQEGEDVNTITRKEAPPKPKLPELSDAQGPSAKHMSPQNLSSDSGEDSGQAEASAGGLSASPKISDTAAPITNPLDSSATSEFEQEHAPHDADRYYGSEEREDRDDGSQAGSDSGITMESYDPEAFNFPRNVNETMAHVLSPPTSIPTFLASPTHSANLSEFSSAQSAAALTDTEDMVASYSPPTPRGSTSPSASASREAGTTLSISTENTEVTANDNEQPQSPGDTFSQFGAFEAPPPTYDQVASESFSLHSGDHSTRNEDHSTDHHSLSSGSNHHGSRSTLQPDPHQSSHGDNTRRPPYDYPSPPYPPSSKRPRSAHPSTSSPISDSSSPNTSRSHGRSLSHHTNEPSSSSHAAPPLLVMSPPTPSPNNLSHLRNPPLQIQTPRSFTLSPQDSTESPGDEDTDSFEDPPTFQAEISPFAAESNRTVFPFQSPEDPSYSPVEQPTPTDFNPSRASANWNQQPSFTVNRTWSGFWSGSHGSPSTPKSETAGSDELARNTVGQASQLDRSETPPRPRSSQRKSTNGSRMSAFFRTSSTTNYATPPNQNAVDLLDDGVGQEGWNREGLDGGVQVLPDPVSDAVGAISKDLWEGIDFGFRAPRWTMPPTAGPFEDPSNWPENITLYGAGSMPFHIRAPTWRSLLRLLASLSNTTVEPSVEALATSRTPTIDLRLVVQFVRTPYMPRGTTRDICLYMVLHREMPAASTKAGKAVRSGDRLTLESWNTRALPYGFICPNGGMLSSKTRQPVSSRSQSSSTPGSTSFDGTPITEQEPDGDDSMFVTLPPPFIELPVKMSDIAMYLHECLVLSRNHAKGRHDWTASTSDKDQSKVTKKNPSSVNLPNDHVANSQVTAGGLHVSIPPPSAQGFDESGKPIKSAGSSLQQAPITRISGLKRLARAVKTFYPEEYALGSSKANVALENAAVENELSGKGKMVNVQTQAKGKGILGAFSRVKGKSLSAKQGISVGGLGVSGSTSGGRDLNAERYELVTPWRPSND